MRLNARLDPQTVSKLDYLVQHTGLSISEVIRHAIEHYYHELHQQQSDPLSVFEKCGFIGTAQIDPGFSSHYKKTFKNLLLPEYK